MAHKIGRAVTGSGRRSRKRRGRRGSAKSRPRIKLRIRLGRTERRMGVRLTHSLD